MKGWVESFDSDQEIEFDGDCITLEMPEDQSSTAEGWKIIPMNPLKVWCIIPIACMYISIHYHRFIKKYLTSLM